MHKCLYMVCPTDHLEPVIYRRFNGRKYFYSSLGNTFSMNETTFKSISATIKKHGITEVFVVLSDDNRIVNDALNGQKSAAIISGLKKPYTQLLKHHENVLSSWKVADKRELTLSYHLNHKIEELRQGLGKFLNDPPIIRGQLFFRKTSSFSDIHSQLVCRDAVLLN